jgi:poly-gamma-glutamate capsule biosynthesis protein CapA/YwtB (metallophosphatase superfamily)
MIISFVGDICLDSIDLEEFILEDEIVSIFKSSDILIGNLENPITESENKRDLLPVHLKSGENSIKILKYFTALSLCNNHIFDFGRKGFNDSQLFLKQHNILNWGAGKNKNEANLPLEIVENNSSKIAFISGTRWSNANSSKHGTASLNGHNKQIRNLKSKGFFIIYYPHWGYEYILTPPPDVRSHARKMIDFGVDLIVGSHPHVLQGYEEYKGKYIFYSLGNFIFHRKHIESLAPTESHKRVKTSVILKVHLRNKSVDRFELHPITFSSQKIKLIQGMKKEEIIDDINKNSKIFKNSRIEYLKAYYSQVSDIVDQNRKIRNNFQNFKKQTFFKKILLFKDVTKQDLLNRLGSSLFHKFVKNEK